MNRKEILEALGDAAGQAALFQEADRVRRQYCGDVAQMRGVVHFSNYCCCDDLYCGLRKSNHDIKRFRMSEDQIVETALAVAEAGLRTVVLQSGEDGYYTRDRVCAIIRRILEKADVAITLSLGERSLEELRAFREAGASRYLMKHETMNPELYARMRPGHTLPQRLQAIALLRQSGYQTGVGNIVGLPGQTLEDLADDIVFFQEFQPDMVNIGPFIPDGNTPLGSAPAGDIELMLRVFALTRIVTANTHLSAANTVATLDPEQGQYRALVQGGANVIMPNCNPFVQSKQDKIEYEFQITTKKRYVSITEARNVLQRAGRTIAQGRGDSLKMQGATHD